MKKKKPAGRSKPRRKSWSELIKENQNALLLGAGATVAAVGTAAVLLNNKDKTSPKPEETPDVLTKEPENILAQPDASANTPAVPPTQPATPPIQLEITSTQSDEPLSPGLGESSQSGSSSLPSQVSPPSNQPPPALPLPDELTLNPDAVAIIPTPLVVEGHNPSRAQGSSSEAVAVQEIEESKANEAQEYAELNAGLTTTYGVYAASLQKDKEKRQQAQEEAAELQRAEARRVEEARQKAAEEAQARLLEIERQKEIRQEAEAEAARQKAETEAKQREAQERAQRLRLEQDAAFEAVLKANFEKKQEEWRLEDARREQEERDRQAAVEAKQKAAEEERKAAEEKRKQAEAKARNEEVKRKQEQAKEEARKAEEEARTQAKVKAQQEAAERQQTEANAQREREAAERLKAKVEAEARAEAEAEAKRQEEQANTEKKRLEDAKREQEAAEKRKEAEEQARLQEERNRQAEAERLEQERQRAEIEANQRREQARADAEAKRIQAEKEREERKQRREEAEAKLKAAVEERERKAKEWQAQLQAWKEDQARKENKWQAEQKAWHEETERLQAERLAKEERDAQQERDQREAAEAAQRLKVQEEERLRREEVARQVQAQQAAAALAERVAKAAAIQKELEAQQREQRAREEETLQNLTKELAETKSSQAKEEARAVRLQQENAGLLKDIEGIQTRSKNIEQSLNQLHEANDEARKQQTRVLEELEAKIQEVADRKTKLAQQAREQEAIKELQAKVASAESELATLRARKATSEEQLRQTQAAFQAQESQTHQEIQTFLRTHAELVRQVTKETEELRVREQQLRAQVTESKAEAARRRTERAQEGAAGLAVERETAQAVLQAEQEHQQLSLAFEASSQRVQQLQGAIRTLEVENKRLLELQTEVAANQQQAAAARAQQEAQLRAVVSERTSQSQQLEAQAAALEEIDAEAALSTFKAQLQQSHELKAAQLQEELGATLQVEQQALQSTQRAQETAQRAAASMSQQVQQQSAAVQQTRQTLGRRQEELDAQRSELEANVASQAQDLKTAQLKLEEAEHELGQQEQTAQEATAALNALWEQKKEAEQRLETKSSEIAAEKHTLIAERQHEADVALQEDVEKTVATRQAKLGNSDNRVRPPLTQYTAPNKFRTLCYLMAEIQRRLRDTRPATDELGTLLARQLELSPKSLAEASPVSQERVVLPREELEQRWQTAGGYLVTLDHARLAWLEIKTFADLWELVPLLTRDPATQKEIFDQMSNHRVAPGLFHADVVFCWWLSWTDVIRDLSVRPVRVQPVARPKPKRTPLKQAFQRVMIFNWQDVDEVKTWENPGEARARKGNKYTEFFDVLDLVKQQHVELDACLPYIAVLLGEHGRYIGHLQAGLLCVQGHNFADHRPCTHFHGPFSRCSRGDDLFEVTSSAYKDLGSFDSVLLFGDLHQTDESKELDQDLINSQNRVGRALLDSLMEYAQDIKVSYVAPRSSNPITMKPTIRNFVRSWIHSFQSKASAAVKNSSLFPEQKFFQPLRWLHAYEGNQNSDPFHWLGNSKHPENLLVWPTNESSDFTHARDWPGISGKDFQFLPEPDTQSATVLWYN